MVRYDSEALSPRRLQAVIIRNPAGIIFGKDVTVYLRARYVKDGERLPWVYLAKRRDLDFFHDPEIDIDNAIRNINNIGRVHSNTHQVSLPLPRNICRLSIALINSAVAVASPFRVVKCMLTYFLHHCYLPTWTFITVVVSWTIAA